MRYIDKDAALEAINDAPQFSNEKITKFDVAMFLNSRPTAVLECGDTISRQAAINAVMDEFKRVPTTAIRAKARLESLPSAQPDLSSYSDKLWRAAYERGKAEAQPQRMRGRWFRVAYAQEYKYQCDKCGRFHRAMYDFCPSCGADMRGGEQDG